MATTLSLDSYIITVIGWVLIFLFTSLIAIIVWLAKTVIKKVDLIFEGQDNFKRQIAEIKLQNQSIKDDVSTIKNQHNEHSSRLNKLEIDAATVSQWIRMTEEFRNRQ